MDNDTKIELMNVMSLNLDVLAERFGIENIAVTWTEDDEGHLVAVGFKAVEAEADGL